MVSYNIIQNFPIHASEVPNAHTMIGPNLAGTSNKTVQKKPDRVVMDYIDVPKYFLKLHQFLTIMEDVIFVKRSPLLITMSCCIKFETVKHIPTRTSNKSSKSLKWVMKIYFRSYTIV